MGVGCAHMCCVRCRTVRTAFRVPHTRVGSKKKKSDASPPHQCSPELIRTRFNTTVSCSCLTFAHHDMSLNGSAVRPLCRAHDVLCCLVLRVTLRCAARTAELRAELLYNIVSYLLRQFVWSKISVQNLISHFPRRFEILVFKFHI